MTLIEGPLQMELTLLAKDTSLHSTSASLTQKKATEYSLDRLASKYRAKAPNLFNLLHGLASNNSESSRDPNVVVPHILGMLLITKSKSSNYLPRIFGIFLYSTGALRQVMDVLSKTGFTVSYNSVMSSLTSLTNDALLRVQKLVLNQDMWFFIVFDNINISLRKLDQRLNNLDEFESGAAASLIPVNVGAEPDIQKSCEHLRLKDLGSNEANKMHRREAFKHHLTSVLSRNHKQFKDYCKPPPKTNNVLSTAKTTLIPLPTMHFNQATTDGNKDIIIHIVLKVLRLPPEYFDHLRRIIFAGDKLTVNRIRSLQAMNWDEHTVYKKFEWVVPVLQLFHLRMNLVSVILKTHFGDKLVRGSLGYNVHLLGRKRIAEDKADFHAADEFLRHTFDAMVLSIWEEELDCKNLATFTQGHDADTLHDHINKSSDNIIENFLTSKGQSERNGPGSVNAALFLRDMLFYLELSSAIKAGDIGRILEVLKYLTILFQAGKTKNYGAELLRLYCGLRHSWTEKTKQAIFASWLVNPKGNENGFIPTDLYQEQNNRLIKDIHAVKGSNASWTFAEQKLSTNIHTFKQVKENMKAQYNTPRNKDNHQSVAPDSDIKAIMRSNAEHLILSKKPQNQQMAKPVVDLIREGYKRVQSASRTRKNMVCKCLEKPDLPCHSEYFEQNIDDACGAQSEMQPEDEIDLGSDNGAESESYPESEPELDGDEADGDNEPVEFDFDTYFSSEIN
ncbi:hypothetical protein BGZ74_004019 [Mortierella antarctica]|nr:hypothetical protein BGZ74_004019 [Mortierella antarctica]